MNNNSLFNQLANREQISKILVYEIEKAILEKRILPGEKLPSENELCKQFKVSRTSVREAISILATHGIVNVEKGKGAFVKNLSSEIVSNSIQKFFDHRLEGDYAFDLIHARQMIEPGIAYYAARYRTEEQLEHMKQAVENLKMENNTIEQHTKADLDFHLELAIASKNQLMPLILKPIYRLMPNFKYSVMVKVKNAKQSAIEMHDRIYKAVAEQNEEEAKSVMIEHLKIAEEHLRIAREEH